MDDEADRQQQQQRMLLATNYVAALRTAATSDCISPLLSLPYPAHLSGTQTPLHVAAK